MTGVRRLACLTAGALTLLLAMWLAWGRARARWETVPEPSAADDTARLPRPAPVSGTGSARPPASPPGERRLRGEVDTREVDAWALHFPAGRQARIWVSGESGASLDCVVQDAAGNLLDVQARGTATCHLRWFPARAGRYRVMVRNSGSAPSAYQLVTN